MALVKSNLDENVELMLLEIHEAIERAKLSSRRAELGSGLSKVMQDYLDGFERSKDWDIQKNGKNLLKGWKAEWAYKNYLDEQSTLWLHIDNSVTDISPFFLSISRAIKDQNAKRPDFIIFSDKSGALDGPAIYAADVKHREWMVDVDEHGNRLVNEALLMFEPAELQQLISFEDATGIDVFLLIYANELPSNGDSSQEGKKRCFYKVAVSTVNTNGHDADYSSEDGLVHMKCAMFRQLERLK